MPLTDVRIRQAKAAEKPYKLTDSGGLFIEIKPNGSKLWRYQYRIAGKSNLFAIGAYPSISLQEARTLHQAARALVAAGFHPAHERARQRSDQAARNVETFRALAEDWIAEKQRGWSPYYAKQVVSYFTRDVYPKIGKRPIRSITPGDVLAIVRAIADRGAEAAAILVRQLLSQVFTYAIRNLRADMDPAHAVRGAIIRPKVQHAQAKGAAEVADLIVRTHEYGGARTTAIALNLLLLLFVRTAEMRKAAWAEFDLARALWTIPAARMKRRRIHLVPLSRQALTLLAELRDITGANKHLFPNSRRPRDVMSATTVNRALEHMGYPSGHFTGHDFRATASTRLHELGFRSEIVEMQLAHAKTDKVAAAYNHAEYLAERTAMMQAWADWIDSARPQQDDSPPPVAKRARGATPQNVTRRAR